MASRGLRKGVLARGLALAVAALAGLISFLSPCILPLVPGYLSYVTGLASDDLRLAREPESSHASGTATVVMLQRTRARRHVLLGSLGFIGGFTLVFMTLNIAFTVAGRFLLVNTRSIEFFAGLITIVLGLGYLGLIPALQRQVRSTWLPRAGLIGSPLLGITFALSWTPCVTPTLTAVIGLASTEGTATRAAALALAYCAGLGIPFIGVGLGIRRVMTMTALVRRHHQWITRIGGVLLIAVGVALATGGWSRFTIWLQATVGAVTIGI